MKKTNPGIVAVSTIVFLVVLGAIPVGILAQHMARFYDGKVSLTADDSIISFPKLARALIFDTAGSYHGVDSIPKWRLIGNHKIDSIAYLDSTAFLSTEEQIVEVQISDSLIALLNKVFPRYLIKGSPKFDRTDTLYWDSIREKLHSLPDLSRHWEIHYINSLAVDSIVNLFKSAPGIIDVHKIEMPSYDSGGVIIWEDGLRENIQR